MPSSTRPASPSHRYCARDAVSCLQRLGILGTLRRSALDRVFLLCMVGDPLPRPVPEHTGRPGGSLGSSHGIAFVTGLPPMEGERRFLMRRHSPDRIELAPVL